MRWIVSLVICVLIAACGGGAQPESARTVAAFEVPLPSEADRTQFLGVLRAAAEPLGMHVDAESAQDIAQEAQASPAFKKTMNAGVWLGANDDEIISSGMDLPENLGRVWIAFFRGKDPQLNTSFRESAMRQIMLRFPDTYPFQSCPPEQFRYPRT